MNDHQLRKAFLLGFMASNEGFNGEYAYDHCSPDSLRIEDRPAMNQGTYKSTADWMSEMQRNPELTRLWKESSEMMDAE